MQHSAVAAVDRRCHPSILRRSHNKQHFTSSRETLLLLRPLGPATNEMANVANGNLEWKVDRSEHLSEEDPPAEAVSSLP